MAEKIKERRAGAEPKTAKPKAKPQNKEATPTKKRTPFKLEAPYAREVCLAGSFNEWNPSIRVLKRDKNGIWATTVVLGPGIYEYRYVVDGEWCDDPNAEERKPNEHGTLNCVIRIAK